MNKIKVIKKMVPIDLDKEFQHYLLQILLNIIHQRNKSTGLLVKENPDGQPKKVLTFLSTYLSLASEKGM